MNKIKYSKYANIYVLIILLFLLLVAAITLIKHIVIDNINTNAKAVAQDDLIYFIMTDRFNNGNTDNDFEVDKNDPLAFHGGDFRGIMNKLDYIKDLGFTTMWITPVFDNEPRGYHGYWAADFYKTEEHFGTMEDLKELVSAAHSKGIKVILDMVVNHTGYRHPWLNDPKYKHWFNPKMEITDWKNQQQVENGWLAGLPDLNQNNPETKQYLIDMAKWWIEQTGVDGYRLDTVKHVPKDFWRDFNAEIKKEYPDFYLIGEVFENDINYIASYSETGIDAFLDFPIYQAITDVFGGYGYATKLAYVIEKSSVYKNRHLMGTFIDNHDVQRFISRTISYRDERLKQAIAFMMTYTGIPIMYYGTEIGMEGKSDPDNRRDMDWSVQSELTDFIKNLVQIRKSNKALTHGDIKILNAHSSFISYSRSYKNNTVIAAFNVSNISKKFEIQISDSKNKRNKIYKDLLNNREFTAHDGKIIMEMDPRQVLILVQK